MMNINAIYRNTFSRDIKRKTKKPLWAMQIVVTSLALLATGIYTSPASAEEITAHETKTSIDQAVGSGFPEAMPEQVTQDITLAGSVGETSELELGGSATLNVGLPDSEERSIVRPSDDTVVFTDPESSFDLSTQPLREEVADSEGIRSLIVIRDSAAPSRYEFSITLEEGQRLATGKELHGGEVDTGEIFLVDQQGVIKAVIDAPWARDANQQPLPTRYEIVDESTLVQTIEFDSDTAFPVVADPSFWQVTKCVASIVAVGAGIVVPSSKLFKAGKALRAWAQTAGGYRAAASLLLRASSRAAKAKLIAGLGRDLALEVLGIAGFQTHCLGD